jgi:prepilin signal peptidase PulO-like enzyme (type II secretory pathway)
MDLTSFDVLLMLWVFLFGSIIGSFLNVVIYRYNSGASLGGRSMCFTCGKKLRWYELVPVFSFLFQRGRCRGCGSKISWQYPLVELTTGMLFLGAFIVAGSYLRFAYLLIQIALLVVISVYDLRHKIIPDLFSYLFAGFAFMYLVYVLYASGWQFELLWQDLIAGPVYFAPFAAMWYVSRGKWMGFGDAKLALGIGWFLGMGQAYLAMLFAFWIGSIVGVFLIVRSKLMAVSHGEEVVTMKSEIPFGPFLILGLLIMLYFGSHINSLLSTFIFY